jgi:Phosphotransferase enzyme family
LPSQEEELAGGNVTKVVRIGDTVRRTAGPCTPTIHRLLAHARAKGLLWVPEPLGLDEAGREILSFLPGEVPHGMPAWIWEEQILTDVARALRAWHDATADFSAPEALWGLPASSPREVICHNDFAPYNCVFRNGKFAGAIDFDLCSPGSRIWDLAYTAYRFVPLLPGPDSQAAIPGEKSHFGIPEMMERLGVFLSAYDSAGGRSAPGRDGLIGAAIDRLHAIAAWTEDFIRGGGNAALADHAAMYRGHARWLGSLRDPDGFLS